MRVIFFLGLLAALSVGPARADSIDLYDSGVLAPIIHDNSPTTALAAELLARDVKSLTGRDAAVSSDPARCSDLCIVIGVWDSPLVSTIARDGGLSLSALSGQWERYQRAVIRTSGRTVLLIAGSDRRGAVWGVIDLSREWGVSAWEWWADVTPRKVARLSVDAAPKLSEPPSVRYRGIFLNDEDWGLEPWAAKTFDRKTGNIGPKTYARIFELMWRLKANTVWPAMHSVSKPFFGDPGNPRLAAEYGLVVGTSHAEPMMRNNLREWDMKLRGPFNFLTNRDGLADYWRERVADSKGLDGIYTVGLRGIHDGPMEGASTPGQRRDVLRDAIGLQRDILSETLGRPADTIPQSLILYKEVEEAYNAGLAVPDDVTLVWSDDNYGYLGRLTAPEEAKRTGGAGIYYHISYWGRPHDYLWLATTHPALIREEMQRAWSLGARREWILNVGDIKPGEYLTQYFLDLAFDSRQFERLPQDHLKDWLSVQFGPEHSGEMASILMGYYDLAWERKPEFMGWGQTEPITPNQRSAYVQSDGEEAERRLAAYDALRIRAEKAVQFLPEDRRAAFFQLLLYPVRAAASLNERVLSLDLADLYARQGRASANFHVERARRAQQRISADTDAYNGMEGGKWRFMMDSAPRRLPVFETPIYPHWSESGRTGCDAAFSGQWWDEANSLTFTTGRPARRSVTLFGYQAQPVDWRLDSNGPSLSLSQPAGRLAEANGYEQRLSVIYHGGAPGGDLRITCGGRPITLPVKFLPTIDTDLPVEDQRIVTVPVAGAAANPFWEIVPQLGSQGSSLRSRLTLPQTPAPPLVYGFVTQSHADGRLVITALPAHPLTPAHGLRLGVSLDDAPMTVLDYATIGRSDEWRENVLSNRAVRSIDLHQLPPGEHRLRLTALDPGFLLDRIEVDLDGAVAHYGALRPADIDTN